MSTYDANGNTISTIKGIYTADGTPSISMTSSPINLTTYTYDELNRLTSFTESGKNVSYTYGLDNLRKTKTVNNETMGFIWNGSNMVAETNENGIFKIHSYTLDGIAMTTQNENNEFYIKNGHGDVIAITYENGSFTGYYHSYDAFGNELSPNQYDTDTFRYAGEYFDTETDLIYLRNRYYNSSNGRFITEDPIKDGLNWYVYCNNDPIKHIDPTGTVPVETIIDVISIGWSYHDFVSNPSWSNFGLLAWDVVAAIVPYAPGSYSAKTIKAGTQILSKSDDYVKSGVWAMKAFERGYEIEKALGGMANNFPVIDKYVISELRQGITYLSKATSIKSIDITADSYKKASTLKGVLKKYVDTLVSFTGTKYNKKEFRMDSSSSKILEVAVPPVEMTSEQAKVFEEIAKYAQEKGIEFITKIVK